MQDSQSASTLHHIRYSGTVYVSLPILFLMAASRFAFSIDEPRRARLKSYADAHSVSAAAILKAIIDRLPATPSDAGVPCRTGPTTGQVNVRLTAREVAALDDHVEKTDFDNRTSWATRALVQAINGSPAMSQTEITDLRRSRSELAAIGRNLNQIARALNIDPQASGPDADTLNATIAAIQEHKRAVIALVQKVEMRGRP